MIITTNFDRLIETALEARGIYPNVISSPAQAEGALPLMHQKCLVLKLHGDYRDSAIKNTEEELAKYSPKIKKLLAEILESCGLIICGWSGEYDFALGDAISAVKNRRFPVYWTRRSKLSNTAARLAHARDAVEVGVTDADSIFDELASRIEALHELDRPHPLSVDMAVASLKRYLVEERHRIRLHDLVTNEAERVYAALADQEKFPLNIQPTVEEFARRMDFYRSIAEKLEAFIARGCYFGEEKHNDLWINCVRRLVAVQDSAGANEIWKKLRLYVALRTFYIAGIAALAREDLKLIYRLFNGSSLTSMPSRESLFRENLCANDVIDSSMQRKIKNKNLSVPGSEHLFESLRQTLEFILPSFEDYEERFDQFEYIFSCDTNFFVVDSSGALEHWFPPGRFCWELTNAIRFSQGEAEKLVSRFERPLPRAYAAGFFGGSPKAYEGTRERLFEVLKRYRFNGFRA